MVGIFNVLRVGYGEGKIEKILKLILVGFFVCCE